MSAHVDLEPAASGLAAVVAAIRDDQLGLPTPCPDYTVGDLLDHVDGLALAFTWAATKEFPETGGDAGPVGDASRLGENWRDRISARLADLGAAWQRDDAWTGMTKAGGIDMPGEVGGLVACDELVVHGWDLARATGQPYAPDAASVGAATAFVASFPDEARGDAFGPAVAVGPDATALEELVALAGRNPDWSA